MEKVRGSIRDWIITARKSNIDLNYLDSNKDEDVKKLQGLDLPQYEWFRCSFFNFNLTNKGLLKYMSRHIGFTVRAIPLPYRKDLPRKPANGLRNFQECFAFLSEAVQGNEGDYNVVMSEWHPQIYGGVVISSQRKVLGEIGRGLDSLCFGQELPLASFEFDRGGLGHMQNKTHWLLEEDKKAKKSLWSAFMHLKKGEDSFDPFLLRGYFEFVVTRREEVKFVDYKDNLSYLV